MLAELQPEWLHGALGVSLCPPAPEEPPSPVLSPSGFGDAPVRPQPCTCQKEIRWRIDTSLCKILTFRNCSSASSEMWERLDTEYKPRGVQGCDSGVGAVGLCHTVRLLQGSAVVGSRVGME